MASSTYRDIVRTSDQTIIAICIDLEYGGLFGIEPGSRHCLYG